MEPITVIKVTTFEQRKKFLSFPWEVYRGDPYWVPPIFSERMAFTDPEKNPFFQHAEVDFFLAQRGEKILGTIAAFTNFRHNEYQEENVGFFGFFETIKDPEVARALLDTAEEWARERGHDALRGPAQFSTNDECGLLVDGFEDSPRILMTYNPRYYQDYLEDLGYQKAMDLWAYQLGTHDFLDIIGERLHRLTSKILARREIVIRKINIKEYDAEVEKLKVLYNGAWSKNWGFVPMDDAEFDQLAEDLRLIVDPDLVYIAEKDGLPVGFSLTLLDLNNPLRLAYPTPDTLEWWLMAKFGWHWKVRNMVDWVRVFALGVIPEYRTMGIDAVFYYRTAQEAIKKGIKFGEMSWILENNHEMNKPIQAMGGKVYKTYRFYEKSL